MRVVLTSSHLTKWQIISTFALCLNQYIGGVRTVEDNFARVATVGSEFHVTAWDPEKLPLIKSVAKEKTAKLRGNISKPHTHIPHVLYSLECVCVWLTGGSRRNSFGICTRWAAFTFKECYTIFGFLMHSDCNIHTPVSVSGLWPCSCKDRVQREEPLQYIMHGMHSTEVVQFDTFLVSQCPES